MTASFHDLAALEGEGRPFVVATVVRAQGSSPQKAGKKMAIRADGSIVGTIGGGRVEHEVIAAAREVLQKGTPRLVRYHLTRELAMCCGGEMEIFLDPVFPKSRLVIFGAGHVGRALAETAGRCGFAVTLVDDREEWLTPERFPTAEELRLEDPRDAIDRLPWSGGDFVVVATHEHRLDEEIVHLLLQRPLRFLGMIGSRRKVERFRQRLAARGLPEETLARLSSPVGLNIGAETPEEIAVSITAELIAVRNDHVRREKAKRWGTEGIDRNVNTTTGVRNAP
ncbi:MAG: xanthine dehydrogenase accessory protein XdhC [Deltaproteobacteria bacterium]|nr:MAG: xanthine dehydrogenase accessory protein XdhC [Deltaproteobacteria bacterium]